MKNKKQDNSKEFLKQISSYSKIQSSFSNVPNFIISYFLAIKDNIIRFVTKGSLSSINAVHPEGPAVIITLALARYPFIRKRRLENVLPMFINFLPKEVSAGPQFKP